MLYRANRSSPIFAELSGILRKTSGLADIVAEALTSLTDQIDVAFIFGSFARGAESAGSDVDLLVVGSVDCLEQITPDRDAVRRLLEAAKRQIADAKVAAIIPAG